MAGRPDIEAGPNDLAGNGYDSNDTETESLLPTTRPEEQALLPSPTKSRTSILNGKHCGHQKFGVLHVSGAFVLGTIACLLAQYAICGSNCFTGRGSAYTAAATYGHQNQDTVSILAPPYVGSTEAHNFPPTKPTNAFPSLFPSNVGYAGGTPTGAEAAVIATAPAYPLHTGQCSHQLLRPASLEADGKKVDDAAKPKGKKSKFNLFHNWGNLSPWFSIERGRFGLDSSPETPDTCRITGLHFLHRHGARYPTAWGE